MESDPGGSSWTRVDRNRIKVTLFVAAYLLSITLSAAVLATGVVAFFGLFVTRQPFSAYFAGLLPLFLMVSGVALVFAALWAAHALFWSEKSLLRRLGAVLTPVQQYLGAKSTLKDMTLAAGFEHSPPLWVIPGCDPVNAFAIGRTRKRTVVGITQGFAERLSPDDQRVVFANMMARVCNGDVLWATAVSALMGPVWRMRDTDLRRGAEDDFEARQVESLSPAIPRSAIPMMGETVGWLGPFLLYALLVLVTELLLAGHEYQAMLVAEKADAEGMLLLKDPAEMLRGLERVLEANNTVPSAGEAYSDLFYCWAGFGFAPEDDPEFRRISRLREVLGLAGLTDEVEHSISPERVAAALAPEAPRLEGRAEEERAG